MGENCSFGIFRERDFSLAILRGEIVLMGLRLTKKNPN